MGILLVYDVNDKTSFQNIRNWMRQIKQHASSNVNSILIANKADLKDRVISTEEGRALAEEFGIEYFETSAKDDINVDDAFRNIAIQIQKRLELEGTVSGQRISNAMSSQESTTILPGNRSTSWLDKNNNTACCT